MKIFNLSCLVIKTNSNGVTTQYDKYEAKTGSHASPQLSGCNTPAEKSLIFRQINLHSK